MRVGKTSLGAGVVVAVCAGLWIPGAAPARACGGPMRELSGDEQLLMVAAAETPVERGDFATAVESLRRFKHIEIPPFATTTEVAVSRRGVRMLARTVAESGGQDDTVARVMGYSTPSARVGWAVERLKMLFALDHDDPQIQTDLGVALSKLPEQRARAVQILESLAERDLVTTGQGWAALAELRTTPADKAQAHRRCVLMSLEAERCGAAPRRPDAPTVAVSGGST